MDKVNIGESTLKDFGNVINEAADILNKGKVAFDNSIPDKTLQVLPYTGQAGALIPSQIGDLNNLTTTAKDNLVNAINEVNDSLNDIGDIDTSNLAKLNEYNIFTNASDFNAHVNLNGEVGISGILRVYSDTIEIGKATTGGLDIQTSDNNVTMNLVDTGTLSLNNRLKSEFQRVLEIPTLDGFNSFSGATEFLSNVRLEMDAWLQVYTATVYDEIDVLGKCAFKCSSTNPGLDIISSEIGRDEITINLADSCTLTMNTRMISELKRLLGIS